MSNGKALTLLLTTIALIVVAWLIVDNIKKAKEIKVLEDEVNKNKIFDKSIREKLQELIHQNPDLNEPVRNELHNIAELIQAKQEIKATFTLAKIIEKLLKDKYGKSEKAIEIAKKNGRKKPVFLDFLELAKNDSLISNEEFLFLSVLKLYRNEEAHELAVKKEKSKIESLFLVGMSLISKLSKAA